MASGNCALGMRVYAAAELYKTVGKADYKAYVDRWAPDVEATADNGMHPLKGTRRSIRSITRH